MGRVVALLFVAAWLVPACGGDSSEADLSEDDAVRVARDFLSSTPDEDVDPDVRIDGVCAQVTFPGMTPVVLSASDGRWVAMQQGETLGSGYEPGAVNCLDGP